MPRIPKLRHVEHMPVQTFYKPVGVPLRELVEVRLNVEELEAVRLKDYLGLDQEACAARMQVSRPTFQRILSSARKKIAEALTGGMALRIEGGCFTLAGGQKGRGKNRQSLE